MNFGHCFFCHSPSHHHWCRHCYNDLFTAGVSRCPVCAGRMATERICTACLTSPPSFDATTVAFDYCYPLDRLIHKIKFHHRPDYLNLLCQPLLDLIKKRQTHLPEAIIAVPLSRQRQRDRGFNQATLMAKLMSKHLAIQYAEPCLRIKDCPPQSSLGRKQRISNVKDVFHCSSIKTYRHIAIVDDVITTGSTVNELAKLLRKNDSIDIEVWALARTVGH